MASREVDYDLDYRSGQPSIVLTRFLTSAWRLFQQHGYAAVEVPVEIGERLPGIALNRNQLGPPATYGRGKTPLLRGAR